MAGGSRTPREEALRRCMELPWLDMYEVWQVLGSYLVPAGARQTDTSRQLRERGEATACLKCAAVHLELPDGQAPTIAAYTRARAELDLPLTSRQIETRWEGWLFAKHALTGERSVETPGQRSIRRAASGRRRNHEEYLTGVREWLQQKPASMTRPDYDVWAQSRNESSAERPVVAGETVTRGLALSWSWALRVADFEMEVQEAQRQYLDALTSASGTLELIGVSGVALVFAVNRTTAQAMTGRAAFPAHVAVIAGARAWYRKDIEAHHAGKSIRRRTAGELQSQIVDSAEVCRTLGLNPGTLIAGIHNERPWAPQPSGSVSGKSFWLRNEFEQWLGNRALPRGRDAKGG